VRHFNVIVAEPYILSMTTITYHFYTRVLKMTREIPVEYTIQIKSALLVKTQPGDLEFYVVRK